MIFCVPSSESVDRLHIPVEVIKTNLLRRCLKNAPIPQ